jgi:hypothetical protein
MPSTYQIAEVLWARCLEAEHKPGRVQFTKYLYLIDYCHWRFHGHQATDAHWIFHLYGPWAAEAYAAMNEIAAAYGFSWGEEEETVLRFVRVDEPPPRQPAGMEGLIQHVLRAFKDRDLNHLLNFAYGQTEPMLAAKRGEPLDFTLVPVDRAMPAFSPPKAKAAEAALHPKMAERVAAFRARTEQLRAKTEQRHAYRESEEYRAAMQLLAEEMGAGWRLPELRARMSEESAAALGEG